ncbi:hypothetical protein GQ44DRAFT_709524 [Phaeosphaeriaceae sp. PMI808]|nr:hypothetical protein GQ44DRAFT_709524 [Phaeosphaeriaceae sp. PMI808]
MIASFFNSHSTTECWPSFAAQCKGVRLSPPSSFTVTRRSIINFSMTPTWPFAAAYNNGVRWEESLAIVSAPSSISLSTVCSIPFSEA